MFPQQAIGGKIKTLSSAIRLCIWSGHQLLAYVFGSFSFFSGLRPLCLLLHPGLRPLCLLYLFGIYLLYILHFFFLFFFFFVWCLEFGVLIECVFTLFWFVIIVRQNDHVLIFSYFGSLSAVHISNFFSVLTAY